MTSRNIVWFRQDLRIHDNPALQAAAEQGDILPIYILDNENAGQWALGGASKWWLHHSLMALDESLNRNLLVLEGDPKTLIPELIKVYQCTGVFWNRCYEPWRIQRDKAIKAQLKASHVNVHSFNGSLLWEPLQVLKSDATPYRVFTPYYRKGCLTRTPPREPNDTPIEPRFIRPKSIESKQAESTLVDSQSRSSQSLETALDALLSKAGIEKLGLLPTLGWDSAFSSEWHPGEFGAEDKLAGFLQQAAFDYREKRDFPTISGTSRLSPHLHFGEISIHRVWHAILRLAAENGMNAFDDSNLDCYLSELGWREFSYYLLYHFPYIPEENHQPKFNAFPWQNNMASLERWQHGLTGYPIVDAGMRELWQTGYMHNRVRMIVGSFLVKNLLIDWRQGEKWFWDCLLDADLASNAASWQWVAGSGADAAPYFRIFNPITQGKKFDAEGEYVKRFVPELKQLPKKYIHEPWKASESDLSACGITLGVNYPKPIVDLSTSRKNALSAFEICQNK